MKWQKQGGFGRTASVEHKILDAADLDTSAPMQLRQLQRCFLNDVFEKQRSLEVETGALGSLTPGEQMAAYRGSVWGNLVRAMNEIFPVTAQLVGERFFDALARRYLQQYPPATSYLNDVGDRFEAFARHFPALGDHPGVVDMIGLEWLWHSAFHAENGVSWSPVELTAMTPDEQMTICFRLQPGVGIMCSRFALDRLWQAHQPGGSLDEVSLEPLASEAAFVVYRDGYEVAIEALSPAYFSLLENIRQGEELASILMVLSLNFPDQDPGALLGQLFSRPLIAGLVQPTESGSSQE